MLCHRVIPLVLLDGYAVVKTIKFDIRRNLGNPITVSRVYNSRNVDELILLDIDASKENRSIDLETVAAVAQECFMPLTVGGGIKDCQDIEKTLKAGADKVSLNTVLFEDPYFFKKAVATFGSQCIVASIDVKKVSGRYAVYSHAKKQVNINLQECLSYLVQSNVGEILLNSVDLDGEMTGYDLELIKLVAAQVGNIPLIVAGGASSSADCVKAVEAGATAVAAASIFHFTSITPMNCKEEMHKRNIPVRL